MDSVAPILRQQFDSSPVCQLFCVNDQVLFLGMGAIFEKVLGFMTLAPGPASKLFVDSTERAIESFYVECRC